MTSISPPKSKSKSRSSATTDDNDEQYNRTTPKEKSLRVNALKAEHDKIRNDRAHTLNSKLPSSTEKSKLQRHTNTDSLPSAGQSASCGQCLTPNTIFYCALCLSERIISHHTNVRRVDEMRQKGKREASSLLGIESVDDHLENIGVEKERGPSARASIAPPDPFEQTSEHLENPSWQDIDRKRMLRANRYHLARLMDEAKARSSLLREDTRKRREKLATRESELAKRREMLDKANRYKDDPSATDEQKGITIPGIELLRADVQNLMRENNRLGQRLAGTRSVLAQEAYTVFRVQPPAGTMASARAAQGKSGPTSRSGRSKERYIPGAFVFDQQSTKRVEQVKAKGPTKDNNATPINPNDWTILGLVMPLSSDVKRFDRHKINGAITYTVQLLELVTFYLGISLPFLISHSSGTLFIKPNALWGSGTRQSLYLSSSSYTTLSATESHTGQSGFGSMGASMISNLGASTMSTLESFVQLPSGKNLPWSKNAPTTDSADMPVPRKEGVDEKTAAATKQFCTALTMLTYDVAYLAHQEGVQVDIVNAAGSILRLLHRTVNSPKAGWKAHATLNKEHRLDDLTFTELDFPQLAQVIEAGGTHSRIKQGASKSTSTYTKGRESQKSAASKTATSSNTKEIIDGSYIDARQAAQSILDVRKAEANEKKKAVEIAKVGHAPPVTTKRSSLAAERASVPSRLSTDRKALPSNRAGTLDFLRSSALPTQPGHAAGAGRESKSSGSNTSKSDEKKTSGRVSTSSKTSKNAELKSGTVVQKVPTPTSQTGDTKSSTAATSGGKVLFNGKEVKGKSTAESTKRGTTRMPVDGRKHDEDEDGWAVL
ncbi:uncharacterized protein FA14DRAFT_189427 [Meira miltonrushii]|uniref:Autophagy-related protein 14 n=1 Tax=Meira miltonrushii TaxID=1280837 RepID=A0A316VD23_9BASI|nr:uncharacterized protein FA14DRAFT_189427 [Meira miltonrushii]PWN35462.1 hypothetical protein FA14DRAFT_189427 [Meira miltonrushii]